jgi:hypothetical protein
MISSIVCRINASLTPKHGPGQRQQQQQNAASSASTSDNTGQKASGQNQSSKEDIDCDEDKLGRGEVNMETDGEDSTEEVNSYNKNGCYVSVWLNEC